MQNVIKFVTSFALARTFHFEGYHCQNILVQYTFKKANYYVDKPCELSLIKVVFFTSLSKSKNIN